MKDFYMMLMLISIVMMSGDSDSFIGWLLWEAVWLMVILFCSYKLGETDE